MSTEVKSFRSIAAALGLSVAAAACAGLPETPEHMMASSGFKTKSVTTPAQKVSFEKLPQGGFTKMSDKGKTLWVYRADPTGRLPSYWGISISSLRISTLERSSASATTGDA